MRIGHFELPADDPARCIKFYEKAFGWRFEKWDGLKPQATSLKPQASWPHSLTLAG